MGPADWPAQNSTTLFTKCGQLTAHRRAGATGKASTTCPAGLIQTADRYRSKKVVVVLCGRNVALDTFLAALEMGRS